MKKTLFFYILLSCILFGMPLYFFKGAIACNLASSMGYAQVLPKVFVANDDPRDITAFDFLADGAARVGQTFGQMTASPTIILTSDKSESDKFFASDTATSHFSPFNNCLVIGPKGQNVDVVAHEMVHAEIYSRLGWLTQMLKMPRWFEEGVSLMVDFREPFLPENILLEQTEIEAIKDLFYGHQFYDENVFNNYRAARLAVDAIDKSQFYADLKRIQQGQSFEDVFDM